MDFKVGEQRSIFKHFLFRDLCSYWIFSLSFLVPSRQCRDGYFKYADDAASLVTWPNNVTYAWKVKRQHLVFFHPPFCSDFLFLLSLFRSISPWYSSFPFRDFTYAMNSVFYLPCEPPRQELLNKWNSETKQLSDLNPHSSRISDPSDNRNTSYVNATVIQIYPIF